MFKTLKQFVVGIADDYKMICVPTDRPVMSYNIEKSRIKTFGTSDEISSLNLYMIMDNYFIIY